MFGRGDFCQIGTLPTLSACPLAPIAPGLRSPTGVSFRPEARQRPRPDAENFGGEVSFCTSHSLHVSSSARASSVGGTLRPSASAVLRLMTSSYLFGA